jgi:hypothetical protein
MDLHERQQFDQMLQTAIERYVERLQQRNQGGENALAGLRTNPQGEGIWLDKFVQAFFEDSLLNNSDGAAFILRALPKRNIPSPPAGTVDSMLRAMAASAFGNLLQRKTEEELERRMSFQAI